MVHTRREARRLGDSPPALSLRALGAHAQALKPRFDAVMTSRQPLGSAVGRGVGDLFSTLRHVAFDRFIDVERSYRGTLLGFHHGLATARLLQDVAERLGEIETAAFCEQLRRERAVLLESAERELRYFAEMPAFAIQSGLRIAARAQG